MSNVHRHMLNIYNGIYVTAISLAVHMLIGSYTGIPYLYGFLAVLIILISIGLEYMTYVSPGARRAIITVTVIVCIIAAGIGAVYLFENDIKNIKEPADIQIGYRFLITIISAILITLACKLIECMKFFSNIFACSLLIFIIGARISGELVELEVFILALYVFIMSVCRAGKDVHYMFMSPLIIIFCIVLYTIPTGTEPMSWNKVWNVIDVAGSRISDMWSDIIKVTGLDMFDSNAKRIGYSDSEKIDIVDEIVGNNRTQLAVVGRQCASSIYLRGSYYNIYNGQGWEREYTDEKYPEYEVMLFETLNAIMNRGTSGYKNLINNTSRIKIKYKELKTDNIFIPYNVIQKEMEADYRYDNGVLRFEDICKENDSYRVWYFNMNEQELSKLYATPQKKGYNKSNDIYKFADAYVHYNIIGSLNNVTLGEIDDLLKNRKDYVKWNYMNIPDCVPQRVYDLANEITKDASGNYEKVKAIEKYLNKNYRYSKKVTRIYMFGKKNECSVDDFLFETKEGSCMHYASALAVLARCIGIPSRITTGYCMRYNDDKGEWVEHPVIGGEGHAWPEVYMGVAGWMRLDPTPTYYEKAYLDDGLNEIDKVKKQSQDGNKNIAAATKDSDMQGEASVPPAGTEATPKTAENNNNNKNTEAVKSSDKTLHSGSGQSGISKELIIIILICSPLLLICLICIALQYRFRKLYYNNSDNSEKCSKIIEDIMNKYTKDMKKSGKNPGLINCTLNESVEIMSEWLSDERDNYENLINAYQGKVFGGIRIDRNTVRKAECLLNRLQKRKKKNKIRI